MTVSNHRLRLKGMLRKIQKISQSLNEKIRIIDEEIQNTTQSQQLDLRQAQSKLDKEISVVSLNHWSIDLLAGQKYIQKINQVNSKFK